MQRLELSEHTRHIGSGADHAVPNVQLERLLVVTGRCVLLIGLSGYAPDK